MRLLHHGSRPGTFGKAVLGLFVSSLVTGGFVVGLAATSPATASTSDTAAASTATPTLPFAMPSTAVLRSSPHLVFAHYWPPLPISLDNKPIATDYYSRNYMTVDGENGKHAAYGGYLRDRPIPRDPVASTDWRLLDQETEVRQAISEGIDGFTLDIMQIPGDPDTQVWASTQLMMQAAQAVDPGFKIMLMPDMSGTMADKDVNTLAQYVAQLGNQPSAYHLADGRLVVSPFDAEQHTEAWWANWISVMKSTYGISVAFVPLFVGDEQNYAASFAPISYGMSNWGSRNPDWNSPTALYKTSPVGRAESIEALGEKWMQPVSIQDERPDQGIFDEAENTTNLRDTWQIAMESKANWVQLTTWNDYSEGAQFAPSEMHGWTYLDISAFYLAWYKTGVEPTITTDAVYLTHRTQLVGAVQSTPESLLMRLRGGSPARDTVEALSFLTAPATVKITDGGKTYTCDQPAGVSECTEPLSVGTVAASVTRSGTAVTSVTSPYPVVAVPRVQDLQYVGVSSLRSGTNAVPVTSSPVSSPVTSPVSSPTPVTSPVGSPVTSPTPSAAPVSPIPTASKSGQAGTSDSTAPISSAASSPPASIVSSPSPSTPAPVLKSTTLSLSPVADAYANQGAPSSNFGSATSLASRSAPGSVSYLRFTLPKLPTGYTLTSASLNLHTSNASIAGSANSLSVALASNSWTESGLTWNNRPAITSPVLATIPAGSKVNTAISASLSKATLVAVQGTTVTLAVTDNGTDSLWFWSREFPTAADQPRLVVTAAPTVTATPAVVTLPTPIVTLSPTADSYANEGAPRTNYGAETTLVSRGTPGAVTYLKFTLPAAAGRTLARVSLDLHTDGTSVAGSTDKQLVSLASNSWTESGIVWDNRPALSTGLGTIAANVGSNVLFSTALSTTVLKSDLGTTVTIAITNTGTDSLWFWSSEFPVASYQPHLVLTF